jgi:hypothetical protein
MTEEPKSIWKKSWPNLHWLRAWLIVAAATFLVVVIINLAGGISGWPPTVWPDLYVLFVGSLLTAPVFIGLWFFSRRFIGWHNFNWVRAWLVLTAVIFFIVLIVYSAGGTPDVAPTLWPELYFLFAGSLLAGIMLAGLLVFIRRFSSWRNFKQLLFGLACFATLIALFYAEEDWRGWHAWNQFKHEWEAKGEHFDYASVIPSPVPDEQNFALTPIVASCYETYFDKSGHEVRPRNTNIIDRLSMITWRDNHWANIPKENRESPDWQAARTTDLKVWQEYFRSPAPANSKETNSFPVAPQPQSPADDVLLALSKYDSAIEEIREASKLPYSRFPLTYGNGDPAEILLPHLAALKSCAQALNLRALADLQINQSGKALEDIKLSFCLINSLRSEPILISQLVRIAMLQNSIQPVWEGLAEHLWSDAQLVTLEAELAKLDFLADYQLAMRGELGVQGGIMDFLRRHPNEIQNLSGFNGKGGDVQDPPLPDKYTVHLIPAGWFAQNQLRCARMMVSYFIPVADVSQSTFSPTLDRRGDALLKAENKILSPFNVFERLMLPELGTCTRKFAHAQASVDLARTAIALERYRLAHGEFPESLDALAPQFIAQVPHDVIGGQPLKYRREADGQFVLYSNGWNENDDGAKWVSRKNSESVEISQGDWVWRYPVR